MEPSELIKTIYADPPWPERGGGKIKRGADGKRMQGRTGFTAPKGRHSAKPSEMREMIERVSYPPYLELFARETFPSEDWRFMGNEIEEKET